MKNIFIMVNGIFFIFMLMMGSSECAYAYIGPGAGLGMIGSVIAIIIAVLIVVVGLIIYPIRRVMKRKSSVKDN
jgi:hypothetical protein